MTDIILSSFLSLFALFGKEERVDESRAREMLVGYLRHHFGIRNIDAYLDFYTDIRDAYELNESLDVTETVNMICSNLHDQIRAKEKAMLLLRLMEFCGMPESSHDTIFRVMARQFDISDEQYQNYQDFVNGKLTDHVITHQVKGVSGRLKTLHDPFTGLLVFTYEGDETVLLNDVPVLPGAFQVWMQSSVLKSQGATPVYYSTIIGEYNRRRGCDEGTGQSITFCGRDINFRFPKSDNGMHDLSFTLTSGELVAIMGGSGTGKTTLLSLLNGSLSPQEGSITINGHDISEPDAKALIGFVPQDDLLVEELTVRQNLWFTD